MKEIIIPEFVFNNIADAVYKASHLLGSRERKTAADRQIEYAERLVNWVKGDRSNSIPTWIPK